MDAASTLPTPAGGFEPLVDAKQLAQHLHFGVRLVRRLARNHVIPAIDYENGGRHYYRFRISEVESALKAER